MATYGRMEAVVENASGRGLALLGCDHASNFIPAELCGLGLPASALADHAAWDIGALALARRIAAELDCALIAAPASRLLVDPNRALDAPDLIPLTAEGAPVPGNAGLDADERAARVVAFHAPFHETIEAHLADHADVTALISVHSFTPILFGQARPWHAGMLHGPDARLADEMLRQLAREQALMVGRNQPYAPGDGVFYTLDRHAGGRAALMIEVRNDLIRDEIGQARWARILAEALSAALSALSGGSVRSKPEAIGGRK